MNYMLYLYDLLKLFHIISAAMLLTSFSYSSWLWLSAQEAALTRISAQTWAIIIPCALFQLATGFTLVSLKRSDLPEQWIAECTLSFIIAMAAWFSFIYLSLFSSLATILKKTQSILLMLCAISLLTMVFLMANKPVGTPL